jgi:hypothetical protein
MTYHLYSLADSREPGQVRYIGYTRRGRNRLTGHLGAALQKTFRKSHKNYWIRKVVREGGTIVFRPLCVIGTADEAKAIEIAAIRNYTRHGHELLNNTSGGDGFNSTHSEETRAKMSAAALARIERDPEHLALWRARRGPITDEYREKMSAVMTGKPKTHEHAMKVGAAHKGRPKSAEQRAKISATKKGNSPVPPEMRAQISAKMTGVPKSEETRARMREAQQRRFAEKRAREGIEPT